MNGFAEESSTTSSDRGNRTTTPISHAQKQKQEKQKKQHHTHCELAMQNLQTINNDVIQCGLCFKTLIDAHVLDHPDCLHRFCGTCISDSLQIMNNGECPICRVHISCMTQIKRDPQFDAMAEGALHVMKLLLDAGDGDADADANADADDGIECAKPNSHAHPTLDISENQDNSFSINQETKDSSHSYSNEGEIESTTSNGEPDVGHSRQYKKRARPLEDIEEQMMNLITNNPSCYGDSSQGGTAEEINYANHCNGVASASSALPLSSDEEESDKDENYLPYNRNEPRYRKPLSSDEEESDY